MADRVAALPMYRVGDAAAVFWRAVAVRLRDGFGLAGAPDTLSEPRDLLAFWRRPDLLLAQTCGYPLVTSLRGQVQLVATPRYRAPGCVGAAYRSALVVRAEDGRPSLAAFRGATAAVNGLDSNSGMNLLRAAVAPLSTEGSFFGRVLRTGAHLASLDAVASGAADIAAIDCVTFALATRDDPVLAARVRVLDWTAPTLGLPLVTGLATTPAELAALRAALDEAAASPALATARAAMLLDGFVVTTAADYAPILDLEAEAVAAGYPQIA